MIEPHRGILAEPEASIEEITAATEAAFLLAAEGHRRDGVSMAVCLNGNLISIPPDELPRWADRFPELPEPSRKACPDSVSVGQTAATPN